MDKLCFVTTCMGRLEHLEQTLPSAALQPDASCVVVDYSCPDRSGDWVERRHPGVTVVRVPGQTRFNRSRAANAGGFAARAPWICFIDCDVRVADDFVSRLAPLEPGSYYCPAPNGDGITGTFICARQDFERVGGFDDVYEGWGERDLDLYRALEFAGVSRRAFPAALLEHIPHDDELRTQFHDLRARLLAATINAIYRLVKFDVMELTGEPLSLATRRVLYAHARAMAPHDGPTRRTHAVTVDVRGTTTTLVYAFHTSKEPRWERLLTKSRGWLTHAGFPLAPTSRLDRLIHRRRLPIGGRLGRPQVSRTPR